MDENNEITSSNDEELKIPESPKPLAFTVDFGDGKTVDTQRHKTLVEKFQRKHRRGQSLSKIEEPPVNPTKKHPLTGNLPRKSSFQSEGYFSSDEKSDRSKNVVRGNSAKRGELSLPLKNPITDKMTQSYPSTQFFNINTPEIELKDVSSPELDLISPYSPKDKTQLPKAKLPISSPECEAQQNDNFIEGTEFDFDKSDTVSDAGTYTLDADNYSEEQKARMSIDTEFKIEQVSVLKKTEEYVKSLCTYKEIIESDVTVKPTQDSTATSQDLSNKLLQQNPPPYTKNFAHKSNTKMLSPILSPTQNLSITQNVDNEKLMNNGSNDVANKTFTKIMFPSPKARNNNGLEQLVDQGSVISVTSSGAFRIKNEKEKPIVRKLSLTKSEIQVQTYVDDKVESVATPLKNNTRKLTANIVNVQSISMKHQESNDSTDEKVLSGSLLLGKVTNLPPSVGGFSGKMSPTKIPSPIHTLSRPRSRNSLCSLNIDLSDSSLETESYLKPTQNCINALEQRLSLDDDESDQESEYDNKYGLQLNNSPHILLKQKATHIRHNSLDDKAMKISNKLEHFQNKNLQGIDQTYSNMFNQYNQNKVMQKIQNSPNNSPIRRSSSFTTKNQINLNIPTKNTNIVQKESNLRNSPSLTRNTSIQRSASTANIKPNYIQLRRSSVSSDHQKIDRNQFGDTESSSEEDFDKTLTKKKDLSNLTNTRYNRAVTLRRARLDEPTIPPKCPNTPEMRRKFQPDHVRMERAISVDRKPQKTNEVQSRYLLNVTKKNTPTSNCSSNSNRIEPNKYVPKIGSTPNKVVASNKPQVFSRTDSGRFSMRTTKPPTTGAQKTAKKDGSGKKSSGRSNSSLSSREKEFQNWKRRKSYDPMKAAAEGKRKEIAKRQNIMTQSYSEANQNQDCDSSPSHSSSVHRSQSFHGTAALEQLISSEEEEDLTLSADEGFSPPTPSPCELSPARASLRNTWKDHVLH